MLETCLMMREYLRGTREGVENHACEERINLLLEINLLFLKESKQL